MYCRSNKRRSNGQAIAELAPGLFLLLLMTFFPFLDLITICFAYGSTYYVNNLASYQLSVSPRSDRDLVIARVNRAFVSAAPGIAAFLGIDNPSDTGQIRHAVAYNRPTPGGDPGTVVTTSTLRVKPPLVTMQLLGTIVPGLSSQINFSSTSEKIWEVPDTGIMRVEAVDARL